LLDSSIPTPLLTQAALRPLHTNATTEAAELNKLTAQSSLLAAILLLHTDAEMVHAPLPRRAALFKLLHAPLD
jgi:hypothetical protein